MSLHNQYLGKTKQGLIAERVVSNPTIPTNWWNTNWRKRIRATITDNTINTLDEEFLKIHRTIPELIGLNVDELRFIFYTDAPIPDNLNPELPYDIVKFDSNTGELFVYILLESVRPNAQIYIYFDNPLVSQSPTITPLPYHGQHFFLNFEDSLVDPTGHFTFDSSPSINLQQYANGINSRALNLTPNYYVTSHTNDRVTNLDSGFSLHCAINLADVDSTRRHGLIELSTGSVNSKALLFCEYNKYKFRIVLEDDTFHTVSSVSDVAIDQWVHVAGVYHHDRNYIQIFVNGNLEATLNLPDNSRLNLSDQNDGFVTIGALTGGIYPFVGLIDNVGWATFYEQQGHFYTRYRNTFFNSQFWNLDNVETII